MSEGTKAELVDAFGELLPHLDGRQQRLTLGAAAGVLGRAQQHSDPCPTGRRGQASTSVQSRRRRQAVTPKHPTVSTGTSHQATPVRSTYITLWEGLAPLLPVYGSWSTVRSRSEQRQALATGVGDDWARLGGVAVEAVGFGRGGHVRGGLGQPGVKPLGGFAVGDSRQDTVLTGWTEIDDDGEQAGTGRVLAAHPGHAQHSAVRGLAFFGQGTDYLFHAMDRNFTCSAWAFRGG